MRHVQVLADVEIHVAVAFGGRRSGLPQALPVPGCGGPGPDDGSRNQLRRAAQRSVSSQRARHAAQAHHQQVKGAGGQFGRYQHAGSQPPPGRGVPVQASSPVNVTAPSVRAQCSHRVT
jgi:hypothetical protein